MYDSKGKIRKDILDEMKFIADGLEKRARRSGNTRKSEIYQYALEQLFTKKPNMAYLKAAVNLKHVPVTIDEFLESEEFLGNDPDFKVWPALKRDLQIINADIFTGQHKILEAFDGGATATGKTFVAQITQAYQLHLLSCFAKPYKCWPNFSPKTPLIFMFQSVQEGITRRVIYEPFREMFTDMPWARRNLIWNTEKDHALELDNNIKVVPALANLTKMVGQAIVSCILDEVNFMAVVQDSKQVVGARGQGGIYDQAEIVYNNIVRRRKGRMTTDGPDPGTLSVLSSTRYLGDFMDRRVKEAEENAELHSEGGDVHIMRRKQYEAQPDGNKGPKIRILVGSVEYGTRILKDNEIPGKHFPENATVLEVPAKYSSQFRRDPEGSLRDVCGVATDVISPFITQRHKIIEAILRGEKLGIKPWVVKADVELDLDGMPQIIEENLPHDRNKPRFIHIDLSKTKDRCGIAIIKVLGMESVVKNDVVEFLPHYVLEQAVSIQPSQATELNFPDVRSWVVALKEYYNFNIHTVSFDGFQSIDFQQMLRKAGIQTAEISMDKTLEPYECLKAAIYQDRFDCQDHELLKVELAGLEINSKTGKVDHSPHGSKDIADAVAGAVFSASQNRSVRASTGVAKIDGQQGGPPRERSGGVSRPRSPHRRIRR